MPISITQTPATASLAQSPIVFTLSESSGVIFSSSFQYNADLYYWTGTPNSSGSSKYTLVKYPNDSNVGIFDVGRIINSTLTDLAQTNPSNVKFFAIDGYYQYQSSSAYVTSSKVRSQTYKALDGYGIFQETIGEQIYNTTGFFPLLTDGPATQSYFSTNIGTSGVFVAANGGTLQPTLIKYTGDLGTGNFILSSSTSTSGQIQQYPIGPLQSGFPISVNSTYFTIQPFNSTTPLGSPIRYEIACEQKYPNVRIKWKNRFGQFDWFNFNMISRQSFQSEKRTYQPQLGSWDAPTLSYNQYDSSTLNYIADSKQAISVNTDWINEDYNELLKQLMVSDEIYWIYNESNGDLRPITIVTNSIVFKTGVVDKTIQYTFDFNFGQAYKLII